MYQITDRQKPDFMGNGLGGEALQVKWAGVLCLFLLLTACGPKDSKDVIDDLTDRSQHLESYSSHGTMTINNGQEPQSIDIEVWYQKPNLYRVALTNTKKNITQILLKNKNGVYVLTPHLKKSFRFQSDWPLNSGQVYLYQSILQNVITDPKRHFQAEKNDYRFEVATNNDYHRTWVKQQIWLDQDYLPKRVHILDENNQVMVRVKYDRFKLNTTFDKDAFEMERNLQGAPENTKQTLADSPKTLSAITPGYLPKGSRLIDEETIQGLKGPVVIMRFMGKHPFTLTQRLAKGKEVSTSLKGDLMDLHETAGVWMEIANQQHLSWTVNGKDFELVGKLPIDEMQKIANSVLNQTEK
jgi:outer membrane lipoprotein-sorting protein